MARVLVFEKDESAKNLIIEKLKEIERGVEVVCFDHPKDFETLVEQSGEEEKANLVKFDVVIFDYSLQEPVAWKTTLHHFRLHLTGNTSYCFTAFDSPAVSRKFIFNLQIFNVFYKPFDHLILKESLNLALNAKKDARLIEMKPQAVDGMIGILKEIELVSVCELGFVTMSDTPIAVGSYSKYYSKMFSRGKRQSVWAQCLLSVPIPKMPGRFINKFHFLDLENEGLNLLRHFLHENKTDRTGGSVWDLSESVEHKHLVIGVIEHSSAPNPAFRREIQDHFNNVRVESIALDFSKPLPEKLDQFDAVINLRVDLKVEDIKKWFKDNIPFFLMLDGPVDEKDLKMLFPQYRDVFSHPYDRGYFYRKLKLFLHAAELKEPLDLLNISTSEKIKAANMVKLREISELYLKFRYHRPLEFGDFREFAFVIEDENLIVELPAYCNSVESHKSSDGTELFTHQFIFWGMTDYFLKEIRLWILKNYVTGGEQKGSV